MQTILKGWGKEHQEHTHTQTDESRGEQTDKEETINKTQEKPIRVGQTITKQREEQRQDMENRQDKTNIKQEIQTRTSQQ